ncbi:MAG: flagellar filament capping protein FliD [Actinomycetales bacterium]
MAGISLDGLSSGLDTTALITQLMQVEAIPQTLLKNQVTAAQSNVTALQGLNTQVSALATLAKGNAAAGALNLYTTSSSAPNITATASSTAMSGSIDVRVTQLAQGQLSVSDSLSSWPPVAGGSTALSIVIGGNTTEISPAPTSLDEVVSSVNSAALGVTATKVADGTGGFRIQFASTATGAASAFQVYQGTATDITAGTATKLSATDFRTAQDAKLTLWNGTSTITSASNTFTDLLPGVSMTVSAVTAAADPPTTVTVARDDNQISNVASGLVSSLNNIFAVIINRSAVTTSTDAAGNQTSTAGAFTGNSSVQTISQSLMSAATMPINGHSPSEYGISINKTGTIDFDPTKFAASMASDPVGTQNVLQTMAQRVSDAATAISDPYTGTLTGNITGQKTTVDDLNKQISDWDDRLATRQAILKKSYSDMEVALSSIKAQGTWLTSQLASLPTIGNSNSTSSSGN